MKTGTLINDMTQGPLGRQLIKFSLPYMLASLLQTIYTLVDLAIVGQFVGSTGLSAVSISGNVTFLLYCLGIGLGSGGQILISQQVGAKEYDKLHRTLGTIYTFGIIAALAMMTLGLIITKPVLGLLNTPAEAMDDAVSYLTVCCLGVPFTYMYAGMSDSLRGMGDSLRPFIFIAVAAVTNLVLDLLFVAVFDMGVFGAALATAISQLVSLVFTVVYLYRRRHEVGFDFKLKSFRIDKGILATILRLSLPLVLMNASINLSMMFVSSYMNAYGIIASSVSGVGMKLNGLMNIVSSAVMSAESTIVGQNIAAGKRDRVSRAMYIGWGLCIVFCVVVGGLLRIFPEPMFRIFSSDPEVLAMAPKYMSIAFWMYISFALMAPPLGLINGVGFTSLNLVIALLDGVAARIGLSLLFGVVMDMGLEGFWWGSALAGYVSVILPSIYFFSGLWKKRRTLAGPASAQTA